MGPSQSGKSFVIKKFINNTCTGFIPQLVPKQATRELRDEEKQAIARGEIIDVEHVDKITADLCYQTYGMRTGVGIDTLLSVANSGRVPIVVINDIMAIAKLKRECYKRDKDICVLSVFLFRRIPIRKEFFRESRRRGNVNKEETAQRFDKAKTVYRIYIENMHMFDFVMLNTVKYNKNKIASGDTIVDQQIRSIRDNIILKNIAPRQRANREKPLLYVISGNGASGKDELIEATYAMGKLYAEVLPKYTSRNQDGDDGPELICQNNICGDGFVTNPDYEAYVLRRKENPDKYWTYLANGSFEYSFDIERLRQSLASGHSVVMALSDIPTIERLMEEFPEQVVTIYCNSQISEKEFLKKHGNGEIAKGKLKAFKEKIRDFINNYMLYKHVVIYAENELGHDSDARQEELIDQLFRIFRAYEEKWI